MSHKTAILTGFIILKFVLQYLLISPEYELHRDEFLYLDQANHLAWGYLSVPPLTSWISWIIQVLGNSVFWVKFFPALFGALTILVVWKSIEALNGNTAALILGTTCVLFSAILRLNTLFQPNSLDILCWTSLYYTLIKYFTSEKPKWLYLGAVIFSLGFLNKYNIAFLILGFLPALLMTPQRKLLTNRHFFRAMLLGLFLILPNLVWQFQNHFPVAHHMRELTNTQLVHVDRWNFLMEQLLFFTGSLFVIIPGVAALIYYPPFNKYKSFFWAFFFTLIIFLYFRAKGYYAIGLYPVYIAFGAFYLSEVLNEGRKRLLLMALVALPVLFFIPMSQVIFPNKSPEYIFRNPEKYKSLGLLRWEDGQDHPLPQDFADMLGWKELARKVDSVFSTLPHPEQTLVLCDNYGQAGAINYYSKQGIRALSFNADYINWFDLSQPYTNLIRIKYKSEIEEEMKETGPFFETAWVADSVTNRFARESGTAILVFTNARIDVNKRIEKEITEIKSRH